MTRTQLLSALALLSTVAMAALAGVTAAEAQETELAALDAAADAAPRDHAALRAYGMGLLRAGRYAEARRTLDRAVRLAPRGSLEARFDVARVAFAEGDHTAAERACRALSRLEKRAVLTLVCNARADLVWNRSARAFEALNEALAADASSYEALVALGEAHRLRASVAEAESAYARATAVSPSSAEPHLGLGRLFAAAGRRDEAVAALRRALALDPTSPDAEYELGRLLGGTTEALDLLARAAAGRPSWAEAQVAIGEARLSAGQVAEAEAAFSAAIRLNDDLAVAHSGVGRARAARGDWAGAETPLRTAIALVANDATATLALGDVLAHTDREDEAFETYRHASELSGSPEGLLRAARVALEHGRDVLASGFLDRALDRTPDLAAALALYGDVMVARRNSASARDYYTRALAGSGELSDRARVEAALASLR